MFRLGFRIKLLLSMLTVVGLCTAVMLRVSLRRVEAAHDQLFRDRVNEQLTYLPREQEARLGAVRQKAMDFAKRPQVRSALEGRETTKLYQLARHQLQRMLAEEFRKLAEEMETEENIAARLAMSRRMRGTLDQFASQLDAPRLGQRKSFAPSPLRTALENPSGTVAQIYDRAVAETRRSIADQLRGLSAGIQRVGNLPPATRPSAAYADVTPAARHAMGIGGREQAQTITASFLVFLGEQGELLQPEARFGGFFDNANRRQFRQRIEEFESQLVMLEKQGVGYLALEEDGEGGLIELVCTPVEQVGGGRKIGTLVLGFPLSTRGEQTLSDISDLMTGMWVDGHLHSRAITADAAAPLTTWLRRNVRGKQPEDRIDLVNLNGVPYRVFYSQMKNDAGLPTAYKVGLYSWAAPLAMRAELRDQILLLGGLIGLATMVLSWIISLGLFKPLRRLYKATMRLREGDYDVRIPVRSNDEFGKLAHAFNETAQELSLKNKYRDLLKKVADKEVVDRLLEGNVALGGETHGMTVLFCDIRKFTELTQHISPEETVALLNEHMTAMTWVIHEHGGMVDKFVGDMIMAVFGATDKDPTAPERAVACARHMLQERKVLNMLRGQDINVGIGIATGEMLAGFMGSEDRLNFTVIGQGANLASRLCTVASPMDILVDEATCEAAREGRTAETLPPMEIKGFSDLQAVYRISPEPAPKNEPVDAPVPTP
ncbi:MAG: adenylate/guanylate cyclase domain-containing protein [Verrucomicrobiia bacterium]